MKVKCIDNNGRENRIALGHTYEVESFSLKGIGIYHSFIPERFEVIPETTSKLDEAAMRYLRALESSDEEPKAMEEIVKAVEHLKETAILHAQEMAIRQITKARV